MSKKEDIFTQYTVRELFDTVRKGMTWRGKSLDNKIDKFTTGRMWLKEEDITQGIFAVKSSTMHDNYCKWCKDRGITGKTVLTVGQLGKFLISEFKYKTESSSKHYYINKNLKEDDDAKKKRQETHLKRKANTKTQKDS